MSLTQYIKCDRCSTPLQERGARARYVRTVAGLTFVFKTIVEQPGHAMTDLCEPCINEALRGLGQHLAELPAAERTPYKTP